MADGWVLISGHGAGDKTFKVNIDGLQLSHHTRLMGRGRVLALDSGPAGGGLYPLAAVGGAGGAGRWPSYGVIADRWPQPRRAELDVTARLPSLIWRALDDDPGAGSTRIQCGKA